MDEDLDPEVLAAIEASKNEAEEEDLLIKAALEESIRESIDEQKQNLKSSEDEDDPLNCDKQNDEDPETEEPERALDPSDNSENNLEIKENGNSEETPTNGHTSEDTDSKDKGLLSDNNLSNENDEKEETEKENGESSDRKPDGENNKAHSPGGEIRLEGEPVIDEDPFKDDDNGNDDDGDSSSKCKLVKVELNKVKCDPSSTLSKNGVKREAGSDSESEDETALSKRSRAPKSSGKRKRSASSDSDSGNQKSLRPRGKSSKGLYPCSVCTFNRYLGVDFFLFFQFKRFY